MAIIIIIIIIIIITVLCVNASWLYSPFWNLVQLQTTFKAYFDFNIILWYFRKVYHGLRLSTELLSQNWHKNARKTTKMYLVKLQTKTRLSEASPYIYNYPLLTSSTVT